MFSRLIHFSVLGWCFSGLTALSQEKPPNILLILVDDLGIHDLACEGSIFHETPHLDAIAARSMRFTHAYSACQVCSPSRAAIQTGRYPARLGITDYIGAPQPQQWKRNTKLLPAPYRTELPDEEITLAESLKPLGYQTFFAGKWHLTATDMLPTRQGYDHNLGGNAAGTPHNGFFSPYRNPNLADGPVGESLPLRLAAETSQFIRQAGDAPFFAMLSFYSVHAPLETTEDLWRKYRDKAIRLGLPQSRNRFLLDRTLEVRQVQDHPIYAGMIETMDRAVGMVLQTLEDQGLQENTVVVFTSDNGGVSSGDAFATSCLPLRGGKGRQWEGGLRAPLYVSGPAILPGVFNPTPCSGIDLHPTLLALANPAAASSPPGPSFDGISLVPALRGKPLRPRPLFWHYPHYGNQGGEPSAIIHQDGWKLIHYLEDDRHELYDLAADPSEQTNVAHQHPNLVQQLHQTLTTWQADCQAQLPSPNPNYDPRVEAQRLEQLQQKGLAERDAAHAQFLAPNYQPKNGWKGSPSP